MNSKQDSSTKVQRKSSKSTVATETLVLYYSNSGTTQTAAKQIHQMIGGDLLEMKISPDYPSDYETLTKVSKRQIDTDERPTITNLPDLKTYRTILIGFPTWYHRPPMFINTFFETADLKGKTVIPFTTSMSSSISESTPYLKKMAVGTGVSLEEGFRANDESTARRYLTKDNLIK